MPSTKSNNSSRIAWIEGLRIFAAVMILLYHAQLLITDYAYTPQPTGLIANLHLLAAAGDRLGQPLASFLATPVWFGFQFVDVFVLISGFSLVLSLKGKPLETEPFLKRRFLRILSPFWTVVWLSYPILWAIGKATNSYAPDLWHFFAAATFPLLYDYAGEPLLPISGPWWFVSLILSFTFIFPLLWKRFQRWGARNLLLVCLALTLIYRAFAVFAFGGHPTYVMFDTPSNWLPFVPFIAKLSTFVIGMIAAHAYQQGKGVLFWNSQKAFVAGVAFYTVGFVCQFYWIGWVFCDLLLPIGLTLCGMVIFRIIAASDRFATVLVWLGAHSYSYFLIHNFVIDRTINLVIQKNLLLYYVLTPVMVGGTLLLAMAVDSINPLLQRWTFSALKDVDTALTTQPHNPSQSWNSKPSDRVFYSEKGS